MTNWKPAPGYEGRYEVSDTGLVRSLDRTSVDQGGQSAGRQRYFKGRLLRLQPTNRGYLCAELSGVKLSVHVIVLSAFGPPKPSPKHVVNHIDGDKKNNRIENLEWCSYVENYRHARKLGSRDKVLRTV